MEAGRPAVDRYVFGLLRDRVFSARDFMETSQGVCRVMLPPRDVLAGTVTTWAGHVAPHVEDVARRLADAGGVPAPPTLLTRQRRRAARPASARTRPPVPPKPLATPNRCADCGVEIRAARRRCDTCHRLANDKRLARAALVEAEARRVIGHPSSRPEVRERIAASQREQWQRRHAAEPTSGFGSSPSTFRRRVLPKIHPSAHHSWWPRQACLLATARWFGVGSGYPLHAIGQRCSLLVCTRSTERSAGEHWFSGMGLPSKGARMRELGGCRVGHASLRRPSLSNESPSSATVTSSMTQSICTVAAFAPPRPWLAPNAMWAVPSAFSSSSTSPVR